MFLNITYISWIFVAFLIQCFLIQDRRIRIGERVNALRELLPQSGEVIYLCMLEHADNSACVIAS
jgi:hypothetical protein